MTCFSSESFPRFKWFIRSLSGLLSSASLNIEALRNVFQMMMESKRYVRKYVDTVKSGECRCCNNLLCSAEGQFEVVLAISRGQGVVVKLGGEERVDQGAESHAVTPTGGKVLDVDILEENGC